MRYAERNDFQVKAKAYLNQNQIRVNNISNILRFHMHRMLLWMHWGEDTVKQNPKVIRALGNEVSKLTTDAKKHGIPIVLEAEAKYWVGLKVNLMMRSGMTKIYTCGLGSAFCRL